MWEAKRPHILLQYLRGALNKWLPLNQFDQEGIIDQVLLEQFLWDLKDKMQMWVRQHQPQSCEKALRLMEAFSVSEIVCGWGCRLCPPAVTPLHEEKKEPGPQKGTTKGVVCYCCDKFSHVFWECGMGLSNLNHRAAPVPFLKTGPRKQNVTNPWTVVLCLCHRTADGSTL